MLGLPFIGVGEGEFAVVITVGLDVRLVADVDAELVAHLVEEGRLRVVGVAHVVDVGALHEQQLLAALFLRDGVAVGVLALVAVHTLELHGLPVHQEAAVEQFHVTEADAA